MSIPVIGTAVVNSTFWVSRLLMSIDYPVTNFVIVDNSGDAQIQSELYNLSNLSHKYVDNITIINLPANIGVAGAWNLIIKCYMKSAYWIIANDDVAFGPGLLKEMVDILKDQPQCGMIHPNKGDYDLGAWDLFLIKDTIIELFGLFDENTYPAYCEDADYLMRFSHRPIAKVVGLKSSYIHGTGDSRDYYDSGSQTTKTNPKLKVQLEEANKKNIEYLTSKWGAGWRTVQPDSEPFKSQPHYIGETRYDLKFVRSKHMGF